MKGIIARTLTAVCGAGLLATTTGCQALLAYLYDPCYPERYQHQAREEERDWFTPQVENGHILDQTMWNYHFAAGSADLTEGGIAHLQYLARRRPAPDPVIFLQTAQDITYDPKAPPEALNAHRSKLDNERIQAIQRYLAAETAGRHLSFEIVIHDPSDVSIAASPMGTAVRQMNDSAKGSLGGGGGGGGGGH